jgi:hypothetical protein
MDLASRHRIYGPPNWTCGGVIYKGEIDQQWTGLKRGWFFILNIFYS